MSARLQIALSMMGICIVFALSFLVFGYLKTWHFFYLNPMIPPFADTCTITYGAESVKLGNDPMINNPADPWGRRMNYPRIWQYLYKLGLKKEHTYLFGILLVFSYLIGIILFVPRKLSLKSQIIVLFSSFSPAALSGIERGNTDLLLFFIASLCIALSKSKNIYYKSTSYLLVLFGFLLKLFPIFGVVIYLKERKKNVVAIFVISILFCFLYGVLFYNDLYLIKSATPMTYQGTYGIYTLGLAASMVNENLGRIINILSVIMVIAGIGIVVHSIRTRRLFLNEKISNYLDGFRMGSGIFLGTFLLGTNYSYRLIFLIFTIPQLVEWVEMDLTFLSSLAKIALLAILLSLWGNFAIQAMNGLLLFKTVVFIGIKLSHWFAFFSLVLLFIVSLPNKLRNM